MKDLLKRVTDLESSVRPLEADLLTKVLTNEDCAEIYAIIMLTPSGESVSEKLKVFNDRILGRASGGEQ